MATLTIPIVRDFARKSSPKSERGAEVVELLLVMPVLIFVFMGIVDFAFMFQRFAVLTNAAMEGARVGTLPGYQTADVIARVQAYAASGGVDPSTVAVDATPTTVPAPAGGNWPAVQVMVTHNYTLRYVGGMAAFFGGTTLTVPLKARSIMRNQLGS